MSVSTLELVAPCFLTFFGSFPSKSFKKCKGGVALHTFLQVLPSVEPCQPKRVFLIVK